MTDSEGAAEQKTKLHNTQCRHHANIRKSNGSTYCNGRMMSMAAAPQSPTLSDGGDDNNSSSSGSSSSSSSYQDPSNNDLTLITGALLLTADCMGTGILALPGDINTLGQTFGIVFVVLNLPVNLYAGTILSQCALFVEENMLGHTTIAASGDYNEYDDEDNEIDGNINDNYNNSASSTTTTVVEMKEADRAAKSKQKGYSSVNETDPGYNNNQSTESRDEQPNNNHCHSDKATFDFVGLTSMLFDRPILTSNEAITSDAFDLDNNNSSSNQTQQPHHHHQHHHTITYKHPFTKVVLSIYYINLFLVLANYTLVMSHSVKAMAGDNICIPTAGIIASILMFALSQVRTMANLGRSISAISLAALFIVVIQCLYALRGSSSGDAEEEGEGQEEEQLYSTSFDQTLAKMSSVAAIGFAVGSQKLLLNIRQ